MGFQSRIILRVKFAEWLVGCLSEVISLSLKNRLIRSRKEGVKVVLFCHRENTREHYALISLINETGKERLVAIPVATQLTGFASAFWRCSGQMQELRQYPRRFSTGK